MLFDYFPKYVKFEDSNYNIKINSYVKCGV